MVCRGKIRLPSMRRAIHPGASCVDCHTGMHGFVDLAHAPKVGPLVIKTRSREAADAIRYQRDLLPVLRSRYLCAA